MTNAITRAIDTVKFKIPPRILNAVFIDPHQRWRSGPKNVDEGILNSVIRPRVLVDCDLVGGTEALLPMEGVPMERYNDYTSVYRFPKTMTQGRSITSVKNVTFADPTSVSSYGIAANCQNTTLLQAGQAVMDAHAQLPVTSTHRVQLIGENTVMVRDTVILPPNVYLRCVLSNDEQMSHIQLRSIPTFCELVVFAVKSYIYNTYRIEMGMGELFAGQELGIIKEIVDEYRDAEEMYETFLREQWTKTAMMNDNETFSRFIRGLVGGYR